MKRFIQVFFVLVLFVSLGSVGFAHAKQDKYDDVRKVLESLAEVLETFVENMNKAEDAATIAKVVDEFAEAMKGLVPKINEIREKYPDLKHYAGRKE